MRVGRHANHSITLTLTAEEGRLLHGLTDELVALLDERGIQPADGGRHPALARLLPDAYPGDEEASAEFRRFTEDELAGTKTADARGVAAALQAGGPITLTRETVRPWLRCITDVRLALAIRLGIHEDGDEGDESPESQPVKQIYFWLGYLQESLLSAL